MVRQINQVLQGDCVELLKTLPDNSVDLICTDPPYFGVKGGGSKGKFEWWDRQWSTDADFLAWLRQIALESRRVLKPNGSLYCFASTKMAAKVEVMLGEIFCVLSRITWAKPCPFSEINKGASNSGRISKESLRSYYPNTESIIFCEHYGADNIAKGEAGYGAKCDELRGFVFEPLRAYLDGERVRAGLRKDDINICLGFRPSGGMASRKYFSQSQYQLPTQEHYAKIQQSFPGYFTRPYEELRQQYEELRQQYEELRRPFNVTAEVPYTDVWTFPTVQAYKGKHPCEKPAEMLEHIISASSRPGAVVLDCFGGSGSTAIAAKKLGRNYILMELDPHWVAVARQRLGQPTEFVTESSRHSWLEKTTKVRAADQNPQLSLFDLIA